MTPADLDEIILLERRCFKDPWTRRMYLTDLTENELATYLVVRWPAANGEWRMVNGGLQAITLQPPTSNLQSPILAYGGLWLMYDEAHIGTVASHPDWRGCGLGQWLMLALLDAAMARGARLSTLEVRAGNQPAQQLYRKLGYEVAGVRARYYRDGEDGVIMTTPPLADPALQARLAAVREDALARMRVCFDARDSQPG